MSRAVGLKNAHVFAGHRRPATTAVSEQPAYDVIDRVVIEQLVVTVGRPVMAKASLDDSRW